MTQPALLESGQTVRESANELRALRDAYAIRAAAALARHCPAMKHAAWVRYCDELKKFPLAQADGALFLADRIGDYTDHSAVTRFVWLADKVWGFESEALQDVTFPRWHNGKKAFAA